MTLTAMAADSAGRYQHYDQQNPEMHHTNDPASSHDPDQLPIRQYDQYAPRPGATLAATTPFPLHQDNMHEAPLQTSYYAHDAAPQLPPLPMSPRWDYSFHKPKAALMAPSPTDQTQPSLDAFSRTPMPSDRIAHPLPDDNLPYTITPPISEPEPRASTETTRSQNFSRPRKPSIKQPIIESPKPRHTFFPSPFSPPLEPVSDLNSPSPNRPRGQSSASSSVRSASTFSTAPLHPTGDAYDLGPSRLRHARTAPVVRPPPPLPPSRIDSMESSYTRDMAPWLSADESRSSYRSQWSSAQGTWTTARSSVVTRDSSVHSIYNPDEPSIDDVMGLYAKGFHDDSSPEDFDGPADRKKENTMEKRRTQIMEAFAKPQVPLGTPLQSSNLAVPSSGPEVRESTDFFRAETPTSPLKDAAFPEDQDGEDYDKRDSAKDLHDMASPPQPSRQFSSLTSTTTSSAPSSVTVDNEDPGARDRYGFRKANQYITREQYDAWDAGYTEYLDRRRKKWHAFQRENGLMTDDPNRFPEMSAKAKRFVRKGIPPEWRGNAWFFYAGGPFILGQNSGVYASLLRKKARKVDVEAIERDLHRTFPDNIRFRSGAAANTEPDPSANRSGSPDALEGEPDIISSLRRVLHAFAIYNPRIGYCQSLNFLAGLLLLFLETEEQCFWLLNVITRVYLPGTHETSLEGSKVDLGVLMATVRETMPAVWAKIGDEMEGDPNASRPSTAGASLRKVKSRRFRHQAHKSTDRLPPITLCMTAWFMSCFIGTLPIETTLRVWDVFFYEGAKTLFRIALTIFKVGEPEIKAIADPMEMFSVVQAMPRRLIDANALMEACYKKRGGFGNLSEKTIESQRRDRRNKAQLEREKADAPESVPASGNVTEGEDKPRRKGTLFGRRKKDKEKEG